MTGRVHAIAKGGGGLLFHDGQPVMLDGVIAGETVEWRQTGTRRALILGEVTRIIEPSAQRTTPPCPYYGRCGGCNLQHMTYAEQLRCKQEIVVHNLRAIAKQPLPDKFEVLASEPFHYRTKTVFKCAAGRIGFYGRRSHDIFPIDACLLAPACVAEMLPLYARQIDARAASELAVLSNAETCAAALLSPKGLIPLTGDRSVTFHCNDFAYNTEPHHFIQSNMYTLAALNRIVQGAFAALSNPIAVDLFCGAGFFTLPLSQLANTVWAVEQDAGNITALRRNLEINHIHNVIIKHTDAQRIALPPQALILVDPPRSGLDPALIAAIAAAKAKAILYFSCDSATCARDLARLAAHGFFMHALHMIDNFPQTDHLELAAVLWPVQ